MSAIWNLKKSPVFGLQQVVFILIIAMEGFFPNSI